MNLKFLFDEHVPEPVVRGIAGIHRAHQFDSVKGLRMNGASDVQIIQFMATNGYTAFLTRDARQLVRLDEAAALRDNLIHWVCVPQILKLKGGQLQDNLVHFYSAGIRALHMNLLQRTDEVFLLKLEEAKPIGAPSFIRQHC